MSFDNLYVELPDGRYEPVPACAKIDGVTFEMITFPAISDDIGVQDRYVEMRLNGQSHNMAEMLALRTFCGVKSDAVFNEGKFSGDAGRNPYEEQWLRQQAEAAGVSTNGKWYCRGLADFPGDPTAWVGDRGDVLAIAKAKNMTVHGYVEHQGSEVEPMADTTIAPELVDREVKTILEANPGASHEEVREKVYNVRSGLEDNKQPLVKDYFTTDIP